LFAEWVLVFPDTPFQESHSIRERLQNALLQLNREINKEYNIQFSMGFSEYSPAKPRGLDELIAIADQEMYEEKRLTGLEKYVIIYNKDCLG